MNIFIGNTLIFIFWPLIWFYFSGSYYWTIGSAIKHCTAVSQKSVPFLEQRGICSCGFKHKHSIMISTSATERHKKGLTSNFLLNIIFPWQIQTAPWSCTFTSLAVDPDSDCPRQIPFSLMIPASKRIPSTNSFWALFLPLMPLLWNFTETKSKTLHLDCKCNVTSCASLPSLPFQDGLDTLLSYKSKQILFLKNEIEINQ